MRLWADGAQRHCAADEAPCDLLRWLNTFRSDRRFDANEIEEIAKVVSPEGIRLAYEIVPGNLSWPRFSFAAGDSDRGLHGTHHWWCPSVMVGALRFAISHGTIVLQNL